MANIRRRGGKWQVRWREDGQERNLTVHTERAALKLKVEIEEASDRGERYEPRRIGGSTPLGLILEDYIRFSARSHARNTTKRYAQMLELFSRWMGDDAKAELLSYRLLSSYHEHLQNPVTGRHLHRRGIETCRKHIEAIELMWRWAWQRQARGDYVGVPQADSLGLRRIPAPRVRAPTWEQMDACIAEANGWHRRLYLVLRCTGLRVQQALELEWRDLRLPDEGPAWLHIRPELGKSAQERRGRWVPVAPVLVAELAGWTDREGYLLPALASGGRPAGAMRRGPGPGPRWIRRCGEAHRTMRSARGSPRGSSGSGRMWRRWSTSPGTAQVFGNTTSMRMHCRWWRPWGQFHPSHHSIQRDLDVIHYFLSWKVVVGHDMKDC